MIALIGLVLAVVISFAWYYPMVKAQGDRALLQGKDYARIALVYGFCFTTLLIIITEITWDAIVKRTCLSGLPRDIVADFFRAALLEEFFKFWGFMLAKKKLGLRRKIDYMLTAALVGLVYGVVEKAVLGNIGGVVIGLAIPMHIIWQLNQGGHYWEYEQQKAAGNTDAARKEWRLAVLFPFFFHGCWDSGLDIGTWLIGREETVLTILGIVLLLAMVILGMIYCVRSVRKGIRIAKEAPLPEA